MEETNKKPRSKRIRTLSYLTEEQIRQKRHVDRRAQRAYRQRTKDSIADLEQQLLELRESSSRTILQLREELRVLRQHNEELVRCLENIIGSASSALLPLSNGTTSHGRPENQATLSTPQADLFPGAPERWDNQASTPGDSNDEVQQIAEHISATPAGAYGMIQDLVDAPAAVPELSNPIPRQNAHFLLPDSVGERNHPSQIPNPSPEDLHGASSAIAMTWGDKPAAMTVADSSSNPKTSCCPTKGRQYTLRPLHLPATCPLDQILLGFLDSRQEMIARGISAETVVGPAKASLKALVCKELAIYVHPLSRVMSEVLSTYPLVGEVEKMALFYLMHQTMRWQIFTTRESYLFMPTWLRPTQTQLTVRHAAWIDNVPWPGVRDMLIQDPEQYPYKLWTENFTHNVSVNWEYDVSDALAVEGSEDVLHSIFEKHIRNLKNWTVSRQFQRLFPNLVPAIYNS